MRHLWLLLAIGCGARSSLEDVIPPVDASVHHEASPDAGTISSDVSASGLVVDAGDGCFLILDVRMCTGSCTTFDCCESLYDKNGHAVGVGACWIDRGDNGKSPCVPYGTSCEACVWRKPGVAVCVPRYFCDALASVGAGAACAR